MNQATIERLANMQDELCVSIILPITRLPNRRIENTIRLNNLVSEARHQLHQKYQTGVETIDKKLDQQTKLFPRADLKAGMAIFVSNTVSECIPLQFKVNEAVSVQESFRLRELLYSLNENIEFYLLVLSETRSSLYKGQGTDLVELQKSFPLQNTVQDSSPESVQSGKPALARYRSRSKECKLQALDIARSKNLLASGIRESWYHSTRGRIESLYLDKDLKISGHEQDPGVFITEDSTVKGTGEFYSDALEELIARVFKTSGDIIFADSGTLKNFEGVAAILRY